MRCRVTLLWCCLAASLAGCDAGPPAADLPLPEPGEVGDCDARQSCRVQSGDLAFEIRLGPEIHALKPFPVRLKGPAGLEQVSVAFSMQGMDMGRNRYRLEADGAGGWNARVTLPICTSGRSDWRAEFEVRTADRRVQFSVPFVLEK